MCKLDSSYPAKVFKRTRMYPFNKLFACSKKVQFIEHVDQVFGVSLNTRVKKLCRGDDYLGFVIHLGCLIKEYIFSLIGVRRILPSGFGSCQIYCEFRDFWESKGAMADDVSPVAMFLRGFSFLCRRLKISCPGCSLPLHSVY